MKLFRLCYCRAPGSGETLITALWGCHSPRGQAPGGLCPSAPFWQLGRSLPHPPSPPGECRFSLRWTGTNSCPRPLWRLRSMRGRPEKPALGNSTLWIECSRFWQNSPKGNPLWPAGLWKSPSYTGVTLSFLTLGHVWFWVGVTLTSRSMIIFHVIKL